MENREAQALWLLPIAYVVVDRVMGFVMWQLIMVSGETSAMTTAFSLVLSVATALAAACLCVYGHYRLAGPLPVRRAAVMSAIAIPIFVVAGLATLGIANTVLYFSMAPAQALLHYAIGFAALPLAALILASKQPPAAQSAAPAGTAPPPPPSSMGVVLLRVAVGLLSVGLFLGGILFVILILAFGGSHMSNEDYRIMFATLAAIVVFGFCFLCAVGVFRRFLKVARVVVAAVAIPFAAYALIEGGEEGVLAVVGIGVYVAFFWAMCRGMEAKP